MTRAVKERIGLAMLALYFVAAAATFVYLSFFDRRDLEWWRWLFSLIGNFFVSLGWPLFWIHHWLFGDACVIGWLCR